MTQKELIKSIKKLKRRLKRESTLDIRWKELFQHIDNCIEKLTKEEFYDLRQILDIYIKINGHLDVDYHFKSYLPIIDTIREVEKYFKT